MTLTTPYSATFIVGDGETKTFSYLFEEVSESFIGVMVYNSLTGLTSTPTYTVDTDQKQVIFGDDTPAPTADETVCIYRNTPNVQDVAFRTLHGYDAKTLENILSKIVAMIQEIKSNYFSTQVLQGDPWQLDLLSSEDDGATVNIDYTAKKLVKGLYFRITSGNLQVSADGTTYITLPKSDDVAEFRQYEQTLPDSTVIRKLQYRVGNQWFDAEANAQYTADEAYALAESVQTTMNAHINNTQNPHQTSMDKLTDTEFSDLQAGQFISYIGGKWKNVSSSSTASWGAIIGNINDQTDLVNTFVKKAGDTMTGALNIADIASSNTPLLTLTHSATATYKWNIAPRYNSTTLSVYPGSTETNGFRFATTGFVPASNNARYLGAASLKWKGVYTGVINNGYDIAVPVTNSPDTFALKSEVNLAANSGTQLYDTGVWYAKMNSATVVPTGAEYNDRNYADFSQVDGRSRRPIIVIYSCRNGAWNEVETITPPDSYNGYITITSKIWDIPEQAGQQGGEILWSFERQTFTPYPKIVSFENAALTGVSTAPTPTDSSPTNQIVNKDYVDNAITNSGTGRNVGDIFLTMRNDNELNGAVECDGSSYNTTDFTGAQSIGQLLSAGKVPYVSLSDYADEITAKGWCDKFGWDGANTTAFKVPTLNAYIWQKLNTPVVGTGKGLGLIGGSTGTWAGRFNGQGNNGSEYVISNSFNVDTGTGGSGDYIGGGAIGVVTDPTKSALTTDTTGIVSDQRVMVQLAVTATDEALETCTGVLADVAELKYDYVVDFQAPTAANNYTWYRKYKSGWVEMGGQTNDSTDGAVTITLPVQLADANYVPLITGLYITNTGAASNNGASKAAGAFADRTTTSFKLWKQGAVPYGWEIKWMAQA